MKTVKLLFLTTLISLMTSCSKETLLDDVQLKTNEITTTKTSQEKTLTCLDVAILLNTIEIDDNLVNEVKVAIDRSVKYGLGYNYRFNDMLKPKESKVLRTLDMSNSFADVLKQTYPRQTKFNTLDNEDFFTVLANSKLMIRWPNFDKWNGIDKPIIGLASEDGETLYKPELHINGTFVLDSIFITKEYLENNPVWVISESLLSYEELPDFENDEFFNEEGTFFYSQYAVEKLNLKSTKLGKKGLYIANMCFHRHYDTALAGSGEFEFYWQSVPNGKGASRKIMNFSSEGVIDRTLQVDLSVKSAWNISEFTNGIIILEKDGGADKTGSQTLQYMERPGSSLNNVIVSFPYEKNDDMIMNYIWNRLSLCDDENNTSSDGSLKKYYGLDNDFWITFKYFE